MLKEDKIVLAFALAATSVILLGLGWHYFGLDKIVQDKIADKIAQDKIAQQEIEHKNLEKLGIYYDKGGPYYNDERTITNDNIAEFNFSSPEQCLDAWQKRLLLNGNISKGFVVAKYKGNLSQEDVGVIIESFGLGKEDVMPLQTNWLGLNVPQGEEVEWICKLRVNPIFIATEPDFIFQAF